MSHKHNLFDTFKEFDLGNGKKGAFYSLPALEKAGLGAISQLPVSIRLVLESILRNFDGKRVSENNVRQLAQWQPKAERTAEIPFVVARIVLQDFTGVPLLVDLAAMRSAAAKLGQNPGIIEPLVPVDLVVDHSVQVDFAGTADSLARNLDLEFHRNRERYQFLKWGMQAFETFKVVPPGIGIVHQVNLEYLAKGVLSSGHPPIYYPDTLVGTDSHTTMINGLGIVGWGVGGIEAEAGMLGQPVYFLTPDVVGVYLTGALRPGVTATDLALTVTQRLRAAKVVGKFVEFYGPGARALAVVDRATIANMAPEYGATMGYFPVDAESVNYLKATGRTKEQVEAFARGEARLCVLGFDGFGAAALADFGFLGLDLGEEGGHFLRVGAGSGSVRVEPRGELCVESGRSGRFRVSHAREQGTGKRGQGNSRAPVVPYPELPVVAGHGLRAEHLEKRGWAWADDAPWKWRTLEVTWTTFPQCRCLPDGCILWLTSASKDRFESLLQC